jgi:Domain of unknown function (DUF4112)
MARRQPQPYIQEDPLIEWLAWLMDSSIRVGPWSVGLDGFVGLIPGIGDMAGAAVSAVIIVRAMQSGIPKSSVIRMVLNVAFDTLGGTVPLFGDIFDFAFKSNMYNLQIYREAIRGERQPIRDWLFIGLVVVILAAIVLLPLVGLFYLTKLLISHM